jgi:excisionase family DNA binding protein
MHFATPSPGEEPTMSAREYAARAGVTDHHIRDLYHRGEIPGFQLGTSIRLNRAAAYQLFGVTPEDYDRADDAQKVAM